MKHQIYPERHDDDGEYHEPVIVDAPDLIYLQFVDDEFCDAWPEPSPEDERTFASDPINPSDLAYVPLARAERAEAERDALRAQLDAAQEAAHMPDDWPHGLPSWIAQRLYAAYIGIGMASSARRMRRWTS